MNTNCNDENCALCFTNNTCKYNYTFNINEKICSPRLNNPNFDKIEKAILNGEFKGKITSEQIENIHNELKSKLTPDVNKIIETENVIFQLSTLEEQKNNDNPNVSSIDLGECEHRLKEQEGLSIEDNLIVLKIDIKSSELSSTYVQYEIYNPKTFELISMNICKDILITIRVPANLDESAKSIYDSLNKSGYNLFDLND